MLTINNLSSSVLEGISFQSNSQDIVCISGQSGSGKTRLLRAIADLDLNEADVSLDGKFRDEFKASDWRRTVAYLPSDSRWWGKTVSEHFNAVPNAMFSMLGFDGAVADWEVDRLSSGEKQRLSLLRLLANKPRVLLLDEPTANLDTENITRVEDLIKTYVKDTDAIVLWVTHSQEQINRVASRIFTIATGKLVEKQVAL